MTDHDDAVGDLLHFVEQMGAEQDGATRIGEGSRVGAYAILTDVEIPAGAVVAPFSQLDGDAAPG